MTITVDQLLKKMENQLHKAKQANNASGLRENIHSIKILCELILEENVVESSVTNVKPISQVSAPSVLSSKRLDDEEANGDSLFDF